MKNIMHYLGTLTLATTLLLGSAAVMADDTEIYLGTPQAVSQIRPNITFIIDTSGSMATNDVTDTITSTSYDSTVTYSGSCGANNLYWSTTGVAPDCSTKQYVQSGANYCAASANALKSTGYYTDKFAQYNGGTSTWSTLSTSQHTSSYYLECLSDWGIDGKGSASKPYPANGSSGPWNSNSSKGINWASTGGNYTIYSGNYLNWLKNPTTTVTRTRIQTVQSVFANLINSMNNVNVALMRYDARSGTSNKGGYFTMPMQQLTDTNRGNYISTVNAYTAGGYTPLAETMYEAYQFYRGGNVLFGNSTTPGVNVAGVLNPSNSSQYQSPIQYQCQPNAVVLLTDGAPTYDYDADSSIKALSGFSAIPGGTTCTGVGDDPSKNCLDELTQYMHTQDCSSGLTGTQKIDVYTIGFGSEFTTSAGTSAEKTLLANAATKGGGQAFIAGNSADLTDIFNQILINIQGKNSSFVAPAVSVNAFNRMTNNNDVYYALFYPSAQPAWKGNVKRFQLAGNPPVISDVNGVPAVDPSSGFFYTTATSFWSTIQDGGDVTKGGAAAQLALPRTIYTYTSATAPNNSSIITTANQLSETNTAITAAMMGDASMTSTYLSNLLMWARGVDVKDENGDGNTTDIRQSMGDPLHSKPLLINYGGSSTAPDMTLYNADNSGYLEAINTTNGKEVFTFIPQELLPNLHVLFDNSSNIPHPYGLDGAITSWFNDLNGDGVIFNSSGALEPGEFVYLYLGMRRGGNNYYALDVTNRSNPLLKWVIKGGGAGGFHELAQTWSAATKARVKINGTPRDVLIFGGGYDTGEDSNNTAQNDTTGRAIFMVDAETGAKLWQAGPAGSGDDAGTNPNLVLPAMTNSIPADITVLDTNGDGYADLMFTADMRGQVWRFDINNTSNSGANTLVTGSVIAALGDSTAAGNRRFYYAPEVALSKDMTHLNIAIGSGYREHPLDTTIHDAFFVIQDKNIYGPSAGGYGTPLTMSDLFDTTDNTIGGGSAANPATATQITAAQKALAGAKGWYIWLEKSDGTFIGEKVLAKATIFNDVATFTTYTPTTTNLSACQPNLGQAFVYEVSTKDGTPVSDFNKSGGKLTLEDRAMALMNAGIAPSITTMFTTDGVKQFAGPEQLPDPVISLTPRKVYWKTK